MKKLGRVVVLSAALLGGGATVSGCASVGAWWQQFISNPAQQVSTFEQTAQVIIANAQSAWVVIKPLIPAAQQAQAQVDFDKAIFAANHALAVLNDAVVAAAAAHEASPDFSAAMAAVTDAVGQIIAVVNNFRSVAPATLTAPAPGTPNALADMNSGLATLKSFKNFH